MEKIICYTDGGSRGNPGPAAIGAYVTSEAGDKIAELSETIGNSTNNIAEYMAVARCLNGLKEKYGKATRDMDFEIRMDSELVKKQLNAEYQIKDLGLLPHFIEIHNLRVDSFPNIIFTHISRKKNKEADRLVNEALDGV